MSRWPWCTCIKYLWNMKMWFKNTSVILASVINYVNYDSISNFQNPRFGRGEMAYLCVFARLIGESIHYPTIPFPRVILITKVEPIWRNLFRYECLPLTGNQRGSSHTEKITRRKTSPKISTNLVIFFACRIPISETFR